MPVLLEIHPNIRLTEYNRREIAPASLRNIHFAPKNDLRVEGIRSIARAEHGRSRMKVMANSLLDSGFNSGIQPETGLPYRHHLLDGAILIEEGRIIYSVDGRFGRVPDYQQPPEAFVLADAFVSVMYGIMGGNFGINNGPVRRIEATAFFFILSSQNIKGANENSPAVLEIYEQAARGLIQLSCHWQRLSGLEMTQSLPKQNDFNRAVKWAYFVD